MYFFLYTRVRYDLHKKINSIETIDIKLQNNNVWLSTDDASVRYTQQLCDRVSSSTIP